MKTFVLFLFTMSLAFTLFFLGEGVCFPQSVSLSKTASIEGRVLNGVTSEPVNKARLRLSTLDGRDFSEAISANGAFALKNLPPGSYLLRVRRSGFVDTAYATPGSDQAKSPITLAAGQAVHNIVLRLMPLGVIAGHVFSEQGEPLANAVAIASFADTRRDGSSTAFVKRVYTNDLGEYRLYGLPPGRYSVRANYRNEKNSYAATYYPNAPKLGEAKVLEIAPGMVLTGIDVTLSRRETALPSRTKNDVDPSEAGAIEGQVMNLDTGDPVSRALVALEGHGGTSSIHATTTAGASGHFTLQEIPAGSYKLTASRSGFLAVHSASPGSGTVQITARQVTRDVTLGLVPQGVIAGRILGEDHEPLPNVVVMAVISSVHAGKRDLDLVRRVYTDDLGQYRLFGLSRGNYYVDAVYAGEKETGLEIATDRSAVEEPVGEQVYVSTYYPNALSAREGMSLKIRPGDLIAGIDLTLRRSRQVRVRGRLVIPSPAQRRDLRVSLLRRDTSRMARFTPLPTATIKTTGEFEISKVPPGTYVMAADWLNDGKHYSVRQPIDVGTTNIDGVVLTLLPPLQVNGEVQIESADSPDLSSLGVFLHPEESSAMIQGGRAAVKPDGSFSIRDAWPEHYSVDVSGLKDDYYLKSVYVGNQEATPWDVDLSSGSRPLRLVVSANGGRIDGTVLDQSQQPAATTAVALLPEPRLGAPHLYRKVTTDMNGKFVLRGIPPGKYKLFASNQIDMDSYRNPDIEIPFEKQGQAVTVEKNSRETLYLTLVRPEH